jgi:hypothetical protein
MLLQLRFPMSKRMPTYFTSHGGGPWPWLDDWRRPANLQASLARMPAAAGERLGRRQSKHLTFLPI